MISVSAPLPARVWAYLLERFPPAAYTVLVGLFTTSAVTLVGRQTAVAPSFDVVLRAGAVVLLVFLHLRLMDEHKDHAADAVTKAFIELDGDEDPSSLTAAEAKSRGHYLQVRGEALGGPFLLNHHCCSSLPSALTLPSILACKGRACGKLARKEVRRGGCQ